MPKIGLLPCCPKLVTVEEPEDPTHEEQKSAECSSSPVHWPWRGRHFVLFGHQENGGFKAAPSGFSSFGLVVAKRRRVLKSFVFGLRPGSVSPRSSSD
jgi:hypothetical protein